MKFAPTEDDTRWMYDKSMEAGGKAAASAAQYFERSGGIAGVTKGMRESVSKSFGDTRRDVASLFKFADATFEKVDRVNTRNKGGVDQTDIWFKVGAAPARPTGSSWTTARRPTVAGSSPTRSSSSAVSH